MPRSKSQIKGVFAKKLAELDRESDPTEEGRGTEEGKRTEVNTVEIEPLNLTDIAQILVSGGHAWSSIKEYSLSEIGSFLRAIVKKNAMERADLLTQNWMSSNLDYKGINKIVAEVSKSAQAKKSPEQKRQEIKSNWIRLAAYR